MYLVEIDLVEFLAGSSIQKSRNPIFGRNITVEGIHDP